MNQLSIQRRLMDVIEEYYVKSKQLDDALDKFISAGTALRSSCTIRGVYGNEHIDTGSTSIHVLKKHLVKSAWLNVYDGMDIKRLMSANDRNRFEQDLERMTTFDMESVRATFGEYIADPYKSVIKGLAEVFCSLDQSFKSHDKVKIGVAGLPKRVIMSGFGQYCYGYGWDRMRDILNALAAYQQKPLVEHAELRALHEDGESLIRGGVVIDNKNGKTVLSPPRGISLKRYKNGNGHIYFEKDTLKDINMALADYYGEVLADCHEAKPTQRAQSTAVSKDLQYYPTPQHVVDLVLDDIFRVPDNARILEPSCGCGRFLEGMRKRWPGAELFGVEYDASRAAQAISKGFTVMCANFLELTPNPIYDYVIMNPPFYGLHYAKHVNHAFKFLKAGGTLKAILPITARTDHGLLDGRWRDLPVGSFSESGTNINTTVLTIIK